MSRGLLSKRLKELEHAGVIEKGDAEVCETYPGGEEHVVVVVNDPVAFARWHLGEIEWGAALRAEAIEVTGPRTLVRALPTWSNSPEAHRAPARLGPIQ